MTVRQVEVRRGSYHDSVRLMQLSGMLTDLAGVTGILIAMATGLNLDLAAGMGFEVPAEVSANDLIVAVAAANPAAVQVALARLDAELAGSSGGPAADADAVRVVPRTVGSAVRRVGGNLVLISTPGRYAVADALDALDGGASVLLFSDNVPVEQEVLLKDRAAERGLLMMGPDCGTAVISGLGLGFANAVRPGPVGLVSASGTGAQQVMSLLDLAGVGVSHCLGVGGRDLSAAVAGRSTLAALTALDADPTTELIVVISKPPAEDVVVRVRTHAAGLSTPVVFALLAPSPADLDKDVAIGTEITTTTSRSTLGVRAGPGTPGTPDLTAAVRQVLLQLGRSPADLDEDVAIGTEITTTTSRSAGGVGAAGGVGRIRGLFVGGTLCGEAMLIASAALGPVRSNIPLRSAWALPPDLRTDDHAMIDFGDDALTRGRPHPMIDGSLRLARLATEIEDPTCGLVLLDVVLGYGAHPDPAAELVPAIAAATARGLPVVVSLTGTRNDPQGLGTQAGALAAAGAAVFRSNAAATRYAVRLVAGDQ